jgi:hypothetical protein
MNVYKRPMFLQGGGAALPMAAPPNAAPPMAAPPNAGGAAGIPQELQMALAGAEQEGNAIGQGIGQKFVTDMMQGLDGAEDYEQAINALRGNELPLSARYDELGEIVGAEDAKETPESVLALVQPAIMMTEEGAMNSGIGELMQGLTGDVPMEGGMEEGVGSLMAAGQPAEPPMPPGLDPTALGPIPNGAPQGFAVGGAVNRFRNSPVVQNFSEGKEARTLESYASYNPKALTGDVQSLYEERLPLYEKVGAGDQAADKTAFWAQMTQLGLNLAAPPAELRGRSPAEALAAAAKVPFANIAQIGARAAEGKRAARIGALQAAEKAQTAQQAAIFAERKATQDRAFRAQFSREKMTFDREEGVSARAQKAKNLASQQQLERDMLDTRELGLNERQQAQAEIQKKLEELKHGNRLLEQEAKHEDAQESLGITTNAAMERLKLSRQTTTLEAEQQKLAAQRLGFDKKRQADDFGLKTQAQNALESIRGQELGLRREELESIDQHRTRMSEQKAKDSELLEKHREAIVSGNTANREQLLEIERERMNLRGATQQDLNNFNDAMMQHRAEVLAVDKTYKEQLAAAKNAAAGLNAFGKGLNGRILGMFSDADNLRAYADGSLDKLNPSKVLELNNAVTYWQQRKFAPETPGGRSVWLPGNALSPYMKKILGQRSDMIKGLGSKTDLTVPGIGVEDRDGNIMTGDTDAIIREGEGKLPPPPRPVVVSEEATDAAVRDGRGSLGLPATVVELNSAQQKSGEIILASLKQANKNIGRIDAESATGLPKIFNATVNWLVSTARDISGSGSGAGWSDFSRATEATAAIKMLQESVLLIIKQFGHRIAATELTSIRDNMMASPSGWTSDDVAANSYKQTANYMATQLARSKAIVDDADAGGGTYSSKEVGNARLALPMFAELQGSFTSLYEAVRGEGEGVSTIDKEALIDKAMEAGRIK